MCCSIIEILEMKLIYIHFYNIVKCISYIYEKLEHSFTVLIEDSTLLFQDPTRQSAGLSRMPSLL